MARLAELQRQLADPHPLAVPDPQPGEWSPAKLTPKDIEAQQKETAVLSANEDWARKKQKSKKP